MIPLAMIGNLISINGKETNSGSGVNPKRIRTNVKILISK
jgi:hypothetical protein